MLKIEKVSDGQNAVLRLIGRIRVKHLEELKTQIRTRDEETGSKGRDNKWRK